MVSARKDYSIWTDQDYLDLRVKERLREKMPLRLKAEISQEQIDTVVDGLKNGLADIINYVKAQSPDTDVEIIADAKIEEAVNFLMLKIKAAVAHCKYAALARAAGKVPVSLEEFVSKKAGEVTFFERMVELERRLISVGDRFKNPVDDILYQVDKITTTLAVTLTRKTDNKKIVICPLSAFFKSLKYVGGATKS